MIKMPLFLLPLIAIAMPFHAQAETNQTQDCRTVIVQDHDRHSFRNRSPFLVDVDGDGQPDTISPRLYTVKARGNQTGANLKAHEEHWISFDLQPSKGAVLKSFFKYRYGTEKADYWVYALIPCRMNKQGSTGLLFYAGDDTSAEAIILINQGNSFRTYSRKVTVFN